MRPAIFVCGGIMMVDRILAMLNALDGSELERLRPVDRRKFAALCHHWWQLAEKRETPKAGILADLKQGERAP
jgi:hypothetical protein